MNPQHSINPRTRTNGKRLSVLLLASLLSMIACSDYVGQYEDEWKDPYGDENAFKEMLNSFDWPWASTCNSGDWIWCSVQEDGSFTSQTATGESWSQFTQGTVSLSFAGKDDNAYNFSTDLLPENLTPIIRRNGGIAVQLEKVSGAFEAGIQIKSDDIAKHSNIVIAYGNEYSEAYLSLRKVDKSGNVESEWRQQLNVGEFEVLTIAYENLEHVKGEKNLNSFIKNEANTIAFVITKKTSVKKGLNVVAVGFSGNALVDPKSSSAKASTATSNSSVKSSSSVKTSTVKSSSSVKSTTAKSSSSVKASTAKSSSSVKSTTAKSSSSVKSSSSIVMQFIWNGKDKSNVIRTGFGSGSPWEALLDTVKNGTTSMFAPKEGIYEACNGLCGFIKFGPQNAWAQESFKLQPSQEKNIAVDVSAMKGLCIAYTSDNNATLYLDSKSKNTLELGAAKVTLPKVEGNDKYYVKNFEWSDFEKGSWKLSGEDAAQSLSSIAIVFEGASGTSQFFNIYQIGSYGMCGNDNEISPVDIDASYFYNMLFKTAWDYLNPSIEYGEMTDKRDEQVYKTVKIGNQTWMAQNLNFKTDSSFCYNDSVSYCEKYGRLYKWSDAIDSAGKYSNISKGCGKGKTCKPMFDNIVGICPGGWHLPSKSEIETLLTYTGATDNPKKLMSQIGWDKVKKGIYGTDDYGFSMLPSGSRYFHYDSLVYATEGYWSYLWTTTQENEEAVYNFDIEASSDNARLEFWTLDNEALPVRCVKTEPIPTDISDEDLIWYGAKAMETQESVLDAFVDTNYFKNDFGFNTTDTKYIELGANITLSAISIEVSNACKGGACGKVLDASESPRLQFIVDSSKTNLEDWGGICVTYSSEADSIILSISTGYSPIFTDGCTTLLPKSEDITTSCRYWTDFQCRMKYDMMLPYVSTIDFIFPPKSDSAKFNIVAVGTYKSAKNVYDEFMEAPNNKTWAQDFMSTTANYEEFTDTRDGKVYKTIQIGSQTWMAQNLNYETPESGCYGGKETNCNIFGRLYTWDEAQSVCPDGWMLPRTRDYRILAENAENDAIAGNNLKTVIGWADWTTSFNGNDKYGFSILPAGLKYGTGNYDWIYKGAYFNTATEDEVNGPCIAEIIEDGNFFSSICSKKDGSMYSVRCLKENNVQDFLNPNITYGEFTDSRDNQVYKTVEIGNQTWMAQNLNFNYNDDVNSWCYDNDTINCKQYGRLYQWSAAKEVCPDGWHLPTKAEFEELIQYVVSENGESEVVQKLKSANGWASNSNGTNDYGFTILPAGYWHPSTGQFAYAGYGMDFWTFTEDNSDDAYLINISFDTESIPRIIAQTKEYGFSVRCLKGDPIINATDFLNPEKTYGEFTDSRDDQVYKTIQIGDQTWMAQNLNYNITGSKCYGDQASNCDFYGRLYDWKTAREVCPTGWHLPKITDFKTMVEKIGTDANKKLLSKQNSGNETMTDDYGFSAILAGYYDYEKYKDNGNATHFWSFTYHAANAAYIFSLSESDYSYNKHSFFDTDGTGFNDQLSVRCIKDGNIKYGTLTDDRDGKEYKTIKIGSQTWMAENLNYDYPEEPSDEIPLSVCYEDKSENCEKYGRLYKWSAAMDSAGLIEGNTANHCGYGKECTPSQPVRGICPTGSHLPDATEWLNLAIATGIEDHAGILLKSSNGGWIDEGYEDWYSNGSDDFGFSVIAAPYVYNAGIESFKHDLAYFWTSTEIDSEKANAVAFAAPWWDIKQDEASKNGNWYSVRCVID